MPHPPPSSPYHARATVTARVGGTARRRALLRLSADSVTVAPATELAAGTIAQLSLKIDATVEFNLRAIATARAPDGTQLFRAGNAEALQLLHVLSTIAANGAARSQVSRLSRPRRRVMVRLAAESAIFELVAIDGDEFVVTGSNMPPGVWTMATFGNTGGVTIRTPVVAGRIDGNSEQSFSVATEDGRQLLELLATVTGVPDQEFADVSSAAVLPETVLYRPFVAPPLVS